MFVEIVLVYFIVVSAAVVEDEDVLFRCRLVVNFAVVDDDYIVKE